MNPAPPVISTAIGSNTTALTPGWPVVRAPGRLTPPGSAGAGIVGWNGGRGGSRRGRRRRARRSRLALAEELVDRLGASRLLEPEHVGAADDRRGGGEGVGGQAVRAEGAELHDESQDVVGRQLVVDGHVVHGRA